MNLVYTDSFTLSTEILVSKGTTPGNGIIPNDVSVRSICIDPGDTGTIQVKGIHSTSKWATVIGPYLIEGLSDDTNKFFYMNASSVTVNVHVKGQLS